MLAAHQDESRFASAATNFGAFLPMLAVTDLTLRLVEFSDYDSSCSL